MLVRANCVRNRFDLAQLIFFIKLLLIAASRTIAIWVTKSGTLPIFIHITIQQQLSIISVALAESWKAMIITE